MNLRAILNKVFETGILTADQERQITVMVQHFPQTGSDYEAVNDLLEALIAGTVVEVPGRWTLTSEA